MSLRRDELSEKNTGCDSGACRGANTCQFADFLPGMIYQFVRRADGSHAFPYASAACKEIFGIESHLLRDDASAILAQIVPEDRPEFYESVDRSAQHLSEWRWEGRIVVDGQTRWIQAASRPQRLADGSIQWDGLVLDITALRLAQERSRQTEQYYRQILDAMTDMIVVKNQGSRLDWSNRAFREYYGMTNDELRDQIDASFNQPDYTRQYLKDDQRVFTTGQPLNIPEEPVTRHDGEVRIFNTVKSPIFDENAGVAQLVAVCRDITAEKKTREALRESQERLDLALRGTSDGLWDWSIPTDDVWYSPRFEQLMGYEPGSLSPRFETWKAHLHPDDHGHTLAALRAHVDDANHPYDVEYRLRTRGGAYRWFRARGAAVRDASGRAVRMAGSIQDVTDRRQAQEALQRSEERYRSLYEDNLSMYFTVSTEGQVLSVNRYGAEQLGYHPQQLVGTSVFEVFHRDDRDAVAKEVAACLAQPGEVRHWEFRKVHRDGHVLWVAETARVIVGPDERPVVMVVCQDITERKFAERELQTTNANLRLLQKIAVAANEAQGVEEAFQNAVDEVCAHTGWPVGHVYVPAEDRPDVLEPTGIWHLDEPQRFETFRRVTEATDFAIGEGLPGRVLALGRPAWIVDVTKDANFPRAKHAEDIGVRGGFGFPVMVGQDVVAVLEFFSPQPAQPDETMLEVMANVGTQLGRVIERKRSQAALADSEQLYRSTFDDAPIGVAHLDIANGRFLRVNTTLCSMLGYPPDELVTMTVIDVTHPDDQALSRKLQKQEAQGEIGDIKFESRYLRKDGRVVWANLRSRVIWSGMGKARFSLAVIEDITQRKEAQVRLEDMVEREQTARQEAQQSQRMIKSILERVSDAFVALDVNWRYTYVNEKASQIFGRRPEDLIGKHIWTEFPEGVGKPFHQAYKRAVARQEMVELEEYYPPWDKWFENRIYASADGLSIFFRDVTERKKALAEIEEKERFSRLLIDSVPCAIAHIAPDGAVLHANAEARRFIGSSLDEAAQRYVTEWSGKTIWEDGRPCSIEDYPAFKCLKTGEPQPPTTIGIYSQEDQLHWVTCTAVPVLDPGLERTGSVILAFLDVTQQKRDEAERKKLEAGLYHAQKMEAVGTLASGVAHDFNNLLTAIGSYNEVARKRLPEAHPALASLEMIEQATRQAIGVTDSLLTFARKPSAKKLPVNMNEAVVAAMRLARGFFPASIETDHQVPEDQTIWVMGNRTALQQVVINLAINARDSMSAGGRLDVRLSQQGEAQGEVGGAEGDAGGVVLEVQDTGCGIEPEILDRIFEPFFTSKARDRGTGMGLSVVHGIVTDHGGKIRVDSTPGQGTRIIVNLPACDPPQATSSGSSSEALGGAEPLARVGILECDEYLREIMISTLETAGYAVEPITSLGQLESFASSQRAERSVAVLDTDCLDEDDSLRTLDLRGMLPSGLPVVAIAPRTQAKVRQREKEDRTLVKPFQMSQLLEVIHGALKDSRSNGGAS